MRKTILFVLLVLALTSTAQNRRRATTPPGPIRIADDFRNGFLGWEARFADYSALTQDMELEPPGGLRRAGPARSVCLRAHRDSGESREFRLGQQTLRAAPARRRPVGGIREQPVVHSDLSGFFTVNIAKGNQSTGGADMSVAGNIAVPGNPCSGDAPFVSIEATLSASFLR